MNKRDPIIPLPPPTLTRKGKGMENNPYAGCVGFLDLFTTGKTS